MSRDIRFKFARQVSGLTQLRLAEAAGVRESLIARIESGRVRPDRETAERIAKILNKRPWEIGI